MDKIFFDYKIDLVKINQEKQFVFELLDIYKLKNIFDGRIYVFFYNNNKKKRNFMFLETGIIDYILQFDAVLEEINNKNFTPFSVSCDYYSNSFRYTYFEGTDSLEIYEVNNALFTIVCKYNDFKKAYEKFRKQTLNELVIFYPDLKMNKIFTSTFKI